MASTNVVWPPDADTAPPLNGNKDVNCGVYVVMQQPCLFTFQNVPTINVSGVDPPSISAAAKVTNEPNMGIKWSSLFSSLPRNAGAFVPRSFDMVSVDGVMIPPPEVIQVGIGYWSKYLVSFFLDTNPYYSVVKDQYHRTWQSKGSLLVHMDNSMFFFKFSRSNECLRILS